MVRELAEERLDIAREHGFALRAAAATMLLGWARSAEGEGADGLATMRAGFAAYEGTGARDDRPYWLAPLAEATVQTGDHDAALRLVDEGLALGNVGSEHGKRMFTGCAVTWRWRRPGRPRQTRPPARRSP